MIELIENVSSSAAGKLKYGNSLYFAAIDRSPEKSTDLVLTLTPDFFKRKNDDNNWDTIELMINPNAFSLRKPSTKEIPELAED